MTGNQLKTFPESIGNLTSLQELYLLNNQLRTLPEFIGNLKSLETLYLGGNQLTTLPESIIKLKSLQTLNLSGKIQSIFYERTFDDLTMANYRILQARLKEMSKDINKLKNRYFEVKAPITLISFDCSECGAKLKISSKEKKFIICEHCNTPFLMEWQK